MASGKKFTFDFLFKKKIIENVWFLIFRTDDE